VKVTTAGVTEHPRGTGWRVVKIGGSALADDAWLRRFADAAAAARTPLVIVHGGGPEISRLSQQLDIPVQWSGGRRVTSESALDVAAMVLSGRVNKRVVAALVNAGVDAVGVSGVDGGLLRAETLEGGALGRVGRVVHVRTDMLRNLLGLGHTIVVSPISIGVDGAPLNVNADDAAAAVASALGATDLVILTDVPGVRDGAGVRTQLDAVEAAHLVSSGVAAGGMAVKVGAALEALAQGVHAVRIGSEQILSDAGAGTLLTAVSQGVA
jgi:acetylglutamate kinase